MSTERDDRQALAAALGLSPRPAWPPRRAPLPWERREASALAVSSGSGAPGAALDLHRSLTPRLLLTAWRKVRVPGGAGVDGVDRARFERDLDRRIAVIHRRVLDGSWRPAPLLRRTVAKADGGTRILGIPTLADRLIQAALSSLLEPVLDRRLSPWVHGYRKGHSAPGAVCHLLRQVGRRPRPWIELLKVDVEALFDRIDHLLLARCAQRLCEDPIWLSLERSWRHRWACSPGRGIPQGAPLSPLLANLVLHHALDVPLDHASRGPEAASLSLVGRVRYADDLVLVSARPGGAPVGLRWVESALARAGLRLGHAKVRHCTPGPPRDRITVLGLPLQLVPAGDDAWRLEPSRPGLLRAMVKEGADRV